jgi:trk system potassium uptake protein TrkH
VLIELLGTLLLFLRFRQLSSPAEAFFQALFHSLSAFNNAGFALFPDSLMSFVGDPLVNLTILTLIILGGLGFVVLVELIQQVRSRLVERQQARLSLHSKLVLVSSGSFIASAMVVLMVLEWNNPATLGPLGLAGKLLASLFQAITLRTAGFNTLDYGQLQSPSIVFSMLLMFIGGNPGSTAGGIKTITFVVLILSAWRVIRGQQDLNIFGRRLLSETVERASVIAFGSLMVIGAALTLLTIIEPEQDFLSLLFETVSAFATVGLSMGITAELTDLGKCVIIVLMYLGRIGLLTFALALVAEQPEGNLRYPAEDVVIG